MVGKYLPGEKFAFTVARDRRSVPLGDQPVTVRVTGARAWRAYGPSFESLASGGATGQATFAEGRGLGWLLLYGSAGGDLGVEVRGAVPP
jgi:hypothetical protein